MAGVMTRREVLKNGLMLFAAGLLARAAPACSFFTPDSIPDLNTLVKLEADHILSCQFLDPHNPAHGAINDVPGSPTWIVPRENGLAILGLIMAGYTDRANLAADYLVRVQAPDGALFDQYDYTKPVLLSKSPTQIAEAMMGINRLGFNSSRYRFMKRGVEYLLSCQDVVNKGGEDDGLVCGGKDENGKYYSQRWASDNAFSFLALEAAQKWAVTANEADFADISGRGSQRVLNGINSVLKIPPEQKDGAVWYSSVDMKDRPVDPGYHSWINYAPQMLDIPAVGVNLPEVGEWIHRNLQAEDGACVWDNRGYKSRKSPGFSFQACLVWEDLNQHEYVQKALQWVFQSGLWDKAGGFVDWKENGISAPSWQRFIDTSFYAIAAMSGGYNFRL